MDFIQRLRPGVRRGEITCSIRIWQRPRVKNGNRYASTGLGHIEIDSIEADRLVGRHSETGARIGIQRRRGVRESGTEDAARPTRVIGWNTRTMYVFTHAAAQDHQDPRSLPQR